VLIACITLAAVDGDTIRCNGENMRLLGDGKPFVSGIDTPEMAGKCRAERMLAKLARKRLSKLLEQGVTVEDSGKRDRTGTHRRLVRVRLPDGRTAGRVLLEEGYAVRWRPGRSADWCSGRP